MRLIPYDSDTLFQVAFTVTDPVDNHPTGARHAATFAQNWMEACDMVRKKYGDDKADCVLVDTVSTIDRSSGDRIETTFYERYPTDREAAPMPESAYG